MRKRTIAIALTLLASVASTSPARAQRAPDMATLDRGDGISKLGLDLGFVGVDGEPYDSALRLELHGQYVTEMGLGFYGAAPLSASFGDDDDPPGDQDEAAFGNVDLGLLFVIDSPSVSWVFRGGVALPTADDNLDGALTNAFAVWPRLTDLALAAPDAVYVRLGFSPLVHVNNFFLRADLGFDLGIDDEDDAVEILRLNAGAGYDLGLVALSLELVNLATLDEFDDDEDFTHTLAFTARFMTERLEPFISAGLPLDGFGRRRIDFFIVGGLQFLL